MITKYIVSLSGAAARTDSFMEKKKQIYLKKEGKRIT